MLITAAFLYLSEGVQLPFAGNFHPAPGDEEESSSRWKQLAIFPADFPIDFLGKLTEIANGSRMIMGCLATGRKCEQVSKHPHHDDLTTEVVVQHSSMAKSALLAVKHPFRGCCNSRTSRNECL